MVRIFLLLLPTFTVLFPTPSSSQRQQIASWIFPKRLTVASGDGASGFFSFSHRSCFKRKSFSTFSSSLKYLSM